MQKMSSAEIKEQNTGLLNDLFSSDKAIQKRASDGLSNWLRTYQRQDGIARRVMPPTPVTESDFDVAVETNAPFIIKQIMPKSAGAISVNYDTGTQVTYMDAPRYKIFLNRLWTPKYKTDKIYLASFRGSLVDVFHDLMLQDLLAQEDLMFVGLMNAAVGTKGAVQDKLGCRQFINMGSAITKTSVMDAVSGMSYSKQNLNPSQAIVHRTFWWKLINTFSASEQGDSIAQDALFGNVQAIEEKMAGITWRTALDYDIIPIGVMYILAAPEYCGDFVTYGEASIFTETTQDIWLEMNAHETLGMSIPNTGAIFRADFKGTAQTWYDMPAEENEEVEG
jgi:hypothetical protein